MMRAIKALLRLIACVIPAHYSGRRDRLSDEADRMTNANNFRGGM